MKKMFFCQLILILVSSCVGRSSYQVNNSTLQENSNERFTTDTVVPILNSKNQFVIDSIVNLHGGVCLLPQNCTLQFHSGAKIVNGKIVGNETGITGNKTQIFDAVEIGGSWAVPVISSSLFVNAEDNLRNVFALASSNIQNMELLT